MLKRAPSLALRASLIFTGVFAAIMVTVAVMSGIQNSADRGADNLHGSVVAADYAAADLRESGSGLQLRSGGRFVNLEARNPSLWLIVVKDGRLFTRGPVGPAALHAVAELQNAVDSVVVRLPGQPLPLGAAALQRRDLDMGTVFIAAGGVDPRALTTRETMHLLFEPELILGLLAIAVISLLATFVAVPLLTRALVPITREASAIVPDDPGRRLQESKAPAELLPLVRGFNAALDRLEFELGRRKRFIADVAHELRTPLAVVSLQADGLPESDGKKDLQRGLRRVTQLVAHMLDLERLSLSAGGREPVGLVAVARDVVADLAPMAIAKGYELSLNEPAKPVFVPSDPHAISRAITNLVANAIAYAGGSGAIVVEVTNDRKILVSDEGPGIGADIKERLFEPFFRGTAEGEGSGLGLHLTREIMTAHGGTVELLPSDCGARFRLVFAAAADG